MPVKFVSFLSVFLIYCTQSFSQPFNNEIAPDQGTTVVFTNADDIGAIDINKTGAGNIWDFSELSSILIEEDVYVNVFSVPFSYYPAFTNPLIPPVASVALEITDQFAFPAPGVTIEQAFGFYYKSEESYLDMGFALSINSVPITARYDHPEILLEFPLELGNQWDSESFVSVNVPGLGYWQQHRERSNEVEASGTILLKGGTEAPALKITSVILIDDSLYNDFIGVPFSPAVRTEVHHSWYAEGFVTPVVEVIEAIGQGGQPVTTIRYQPDFLNAVHEMHRIENEISAAYHPGTGLFIQSEQLIEDGKIIIYNLNGQDVHRIKYSSFTEKQIQLNHLPKGVYLLEIYSAGYRFMERFVRY